ncbi:MAG: TIGR03435 family protein [Silvibacterium sp.]
MVCLAIWTEVWSAGKVNHLWPSAVVTLIAWLLAFALRSNQAWARYRVSKIASVKFLLPFAILIAAGGSFPFGAAAETSCNFEVATIKPVKSDILGHSFRVRGHRFEAINTSLSELISFAYGLHAKQITGAPAWVEADKYDLTAQSDDNCQPSEMLWRGMLRELLIERFKLNLHRDTEMLSVYVLTVGKTGPKLTKSEGDPNGLPALSLTLGAMTATNANLSAVAATNASMADLAGVLQRVVLDGPVVDQTGIAGRYDFTLNWTPDISQFGDVRSRIRFPTGRSDAPPGLFKAIQEQIGLNLDATRAPVEVLVIDHVEKPSDN